MPQNYWMKAVADGEEYGPYSAADVRNFVADGRIVPDSLITLDRTTWHRASRIKGLFPATAILAGNTAVAVAARPAAVSPPELPDVAGIAVAQLAPTEQPYSQQPEAVDHEYDGVFLFLYLVGLIFGILWLIAGGLMLYGVWAYIPALQFTYSQGVPRSTDPHYERVVAPVALLAMGAFFVAAALIRGSGGRRLLLISAILMIAARLLTFALSVPMAFSTSHRTFEPPIWQIVSMVGALILSLAYPLLCIVAVRSWQRNSAV